MERELISWLRQHLPPHPLLRLGLGDDAAMLRLADVQECVITVDMLNEGVDFDLSRIDPRRAGRKALAANLSDLAAMAARPLAGVVALALPRRGAMELAVALYEGMLPLAEQYDLAIAGGDTNSWDGPLAISITLLGAVTLRGPLRRDGAKPGDHILVTGSFGGSILGRHLDFEPRAARGAGVARTLRTARGHRRERWALVGPGSHFGGELLRGGDRHRRRANRGRRPAFGRTPGRLVRRRWTMPFPTAKISSWFWRFRLTRPESCFTSSRLRHRLRTLANSWPT